MDSLGGGLRYARSETGQEEEEDVCGQSGNEDHGAKEESGDTDDRRTAEVIGQPPHREDPEHKEGSRNAGHEDDDARAHVKRRLDVGSQHAQTGALEVVEGDDHGQDRKSRGTGVAQALAQGHVLLTRAGKQILRQQDLVGRPGCTVAFLRALAQGRANLAGSSLPVCLVGVADDASLKGAPTPILPGQRSDNWSNDGRMIGTFFRLCTHILEHGPAASPKPSTLLHQVFEPGEQIGSGEQGRRLSNPRSSSRPRNDRRARSCRAAERRERRPFVDRPRQFGRSCADDVGDIEEALRDKLVHRLHHRELGSEPRLAFTTAVVTSVTMPEDAPGQDPRLEVGWHCS